MNHVAFGKTTMSKSVLSPQSGAWRLSDILAQRLRLAAQPIFNIQSRQPECHEILARLEDPVFGVGDSASFLAELSVSVRHKLEHAVIGCVVDRVRRTAARPCAQDSETACGARTPYLVNIHLRHLSEWLPSIMQLLHGIDPSRLMFEIVEPSYVDAEADDLAALRHLRDAGFHFLLDDLENPDDLQKICQKGLIPHGVKVDFSIGHEVISRIRDACDGLSIGILIGERFDDPIEPLTHIQSFKWGRPHAASTFTMGADKARAATDCQSARFQTLTSPAADRR